VGRVGFLAENELIAFQLKPVTTYITIIMPVVFVMMVERVPARPRSGLS
jgi:hypothetical protein